jgi:hypothetical protein
LKKLLHKLVALFSSSICPSVLRQFFLPALDFDNLDARAS